MKNILVIGGGPGGYVAALRAAQLDCNVTLVEEDRIGGTCLNRGCIPTKSFFASAKLISEMSKGSELGINVDGYSIDFDKVLAHKNNTVDTLISGIEKLLSARKINLIKGTAKFINDNEVEVNGEKINYDYAIIATGSKPFELNIPGLDNKRVLDSTELLNIDHVPKSLAVIGGGVIGMEFATIFNKLGTKVTILEKFTFLANVDLEIVKRFVSKTKKEIPMYDWTDINSIEEGEKLKLLCTNKKGDFEVEADYILACAGRIGSFDNLGLENTTIEHDHRRVIVDSNFKTNLANVYAIGDVNGISQLAHSASDQGIQVVEHILINKDIKEKVVPACIFTFPEIASVGLTEEQAKEKGINYSKNKFMFGANGKALTMCDGDGFVKCISDKDTGKLIGVHIMGPHASDLIAEGGLALGNDMSLSQIGSVIHSHPTLPEAFHETILSLLGEPIHSI